MKNVTVAKYAGFCFGVERAIKTVYDIIKEQSGSRIYTLGKIIHNPIVTEELEAKGVRIISIDDIDSIVKSAEKDNPAVIIVRTHGVTRDISEKLAKSAEDNPYFSFVDCTCPYVKKIHNIVNDNSDADTLTVVFGDSKHPEVEGIKSYANGDVETVLFEEDIEKMASRRKIEPAKTIMVSQTTQNLFECKKSQKKLKKLYTNTKIFDTICSVTENRQKETEELSSKVDIMVIIGGADSSNTNKLFHIAKENCRHAIMIERVSELDEYDFSEYNNIGITAGASTPDSIIQEVRRKMSEELKNVGEENFAQMLEESFKTLNTGDVVTGTVIAVSSNEIHVDLGAKVTGILSYDDITDEPGIKLEEVFKVGDTVQAIAVRVSDVDGVAVLSKKKIDAKNKWSSIVAAYESGEILEGRYVEVVKGGVIMSIDGVRVFVPASHTTVPRDGDLTTVNGKRAKVKIIEIDEAKHRAKASERVVVREERKKAEAEFWANIEVGKHYVGEIKSLTSYGAFVDLGCGIDGMVHVTELSWQRIKNPAQVVAVGQKIEVFVKEFDAEKRRIALGYKTEESNPWTLFTNQYNVGDVVKVKIVSLMPFGAFAQILPGADGLIHISQIADRKIDKPGDVLTVGEEVEAKIVSVDEEKHQIGLSIRALIAPAEEAVEEEEQEDGETLVYSDEAPIEGQNDAE